LTIRRTQESLPTGRLRRIASAIIFRSDSAGGKFTVGEFNLEAQRRAEDFGRGSITETFSGTIIELHCDSCNTLVTDL
jgi:hypothetical protein